MIPYPEPYQNMYQRRRLGSMGIEWHPPSMKFAVGPTFNAHTGDFQTLPIVDLDRLIEPLPEMVDFIDWEYDNELQSDDNDSEYNVTDEYSSEGERLSLSGSSAGETESSGDDTEVDHSNKEGLRRSKRKKCKSEVEITTSSGRRVKRRNFDGPDGTIPLKASKARSSRNGRILSRKKKLKLKSLRPQRRAARNALTLFTKITGGSSDAEDEEDLEISSSESESLLPDSNSQSNESEKSMKNRHMQYGKETETSREECDDFVKPSMMTDFQTSNIGKRRLVLKLKTFNFSGTNRLECQEHGTIKNSPIKVNSGTSNINLTHSETCETEKFSAGRFESLMPQYVGGTRLKEKGNIDMFEHTNNPMAPKATMKWGEVKQRSNKRMRLYDTSTADVWTAFDAPLVGHKNVGGDNGNQICEVEGETTSNSENEAIGVGLDKVDDELIDQLEDGATQILDNGKVYSLPDEQAFKPLQTVLEQDHVDVCKPKEEKLQIGEHRVMDEPRNPLEMVGDRPTLPDNKINDISVQGKLKTSESVCPKLRFKTNGFSKERGELKTIGWVGWRTAEDETTTEKNLITVVPEEDGTTGDSAEHSDWNDGSDSMETWTNKSSSRRYRSVYKRSRSFRGRKNPTGEMNSVDESTSISCNHEENSKSGYTDNLVECLQERRSTSMMASTDDYGTLNEYKISKNSSSNGRDKRNSASKSSVGLRSFRIKRENHNTGLKHFERRKYQHLPKKFSWLMLLEHEEAYRYVPQKGDEVAYLRQGHEEYLDEHGLQDGAPWRLVEGELKAVEFCKVKELDYSTVSGSGESCCKLTLEFLDQNSAGFGKSFKLTLPELDTFPDFLVETTRYLAATARNWTHRDKCQVWWKNEDGDGGSWWEGRILAVKPKSPEFPDSPWERYIIQYKNDSGQHLHSPWELYDADSQWDHPRIDELTRNKLVSQLNKIEQTSLRNQDSYGIQKLNQVSLKYEFLNRFPAPLSLEVIKSRLENNYYRNVEAVKHDASVMISNADSYFARSVEMSSKVRRLADAVARIFSSL